MTWSDAVLAVSVVDGLLAQRKLDGDSTIIANDDREELQRIISQGKRPEGILRQNGQTLFLKQAYARAEVAYVE
jgi:hypothetical protein